MRSYFHFYPTCPDCHEPHLDGFPLEVVNEGRLKCNRCGTQFRDKVDLISSDKFSNTTARIIEKEGEGARKFLNELPLFWEVKLNELEKEYVRWIKKNPEGKFLVTWPWETVKFIPLLVFEYLNANPENRVAVIGRIDSSSLKTSSKENRIGKADVKESFDNLFYFEKRNETKIPREIKTEMNRFDERSLVEKKKLVNYTVRRVGAGYASSGICESSFKKCLRDLKKELVEDFGDGCIRTVDEIRLKQERKEKDINPNGFIDLKLEEMEQYTGNLRYNSKWLWNVLLNTENIKRINRTIPSELVSETEKSGGNNRNKSLFFVPSEMDPGTLFETVEKISPDLVIIQDSDEFISDKIYHGNKSKTFFNFLENSRIPSILMFSSDRDIRHLYEIHQPWKKIVGECGVLPHTCDSDLVMNELLQKDEKTQSRYPNPVCSRWKELEYTEKLPYIEYRELDGLDKLDESFEKIKKSVRSNWLIKDLNKFTQDLKKSPLFVKGAYENPEIFCRMGMSLEKISYTRILSVLDETLTEEEIEVIREAVDNIYATESQNQSNPLLNELIKTVPQFLTGEYDFATVVVHGYDVRGAEQLLSENGFDSQIPWRLSVCSWGDLPRREYEIPRGVNHYVISTLQPFIGYSINSSNVDEFIFLGSPKSIEKIRKILDNRLTEAHSRPLYILSRGDSSPEMLKEIFNEKSEELPSNKELVDLSEELVVDSGSYGYITEERILEKTEGSAHPYLQAGENAILVVDSEGRGMFIPSGSTVTVKENHGLAEKNLEEKSQKKLEKELKGSEVLIDTGGLHRSFRSIFIKNMMEYGSNVTFRKGPHEWKSFQELYQSAIEWILVLREALKKYVEETGKKYEEAEDEFSKYLSSLDLNAENPEYIKGWWADYEIIKTETGMCPVYKVEHPKSFEDLRKIYRGINEKIPDMNLKIEDAERSYMASILLQGFRRSFLKGKKLESKLQHIYKQIERKIGNIVEESPVFRVSLVYSVKLACEVEQFKVVDNYEQCIKTS